jgi:predicted transcriptional regulator
VVSIVDVLSAIRDEKSLLLFKTIARSNSERSTSTLNLRSRQYYSRMSELVKADLVSRRDGKYLLTTFGKIVDHAQTSIETAMGDYWKLKAIDNLENSNQIPQEEYNNIIDLLIDNEGTKEQLIKPYNH